jgi:hypothetical protein
MDKNEKTYLIPESLLKAIVNYLVTRPYGEVHQAMPQLAQLREAPGQQQDRNEDSKAG